MHRDMLGQTAAELRSHINVAQSHINVAQRQPRQRGGFRTCNQIKSRGLGPPDQGLISSLARSSTTASGPWHGWYPER
eukprot:1078502-Rhodomonas_salina.2